MDLKELRQVLNTFGMAVIARSKKKLKSGPLADSLEAKIKQNKNSITLTFLMEEYGLYRDLGVQGKDPSKLPPKARKHKKQQAPLSPYKFGRSNRMPKKGSKGELYKAIDRCVVNKGLKGTRNKLGQFTKRKSLVFLISRSIYFSGLKPSLFFTTPFRIEYKKLPKQIASSFAKDVVSMVQKTVKT